MRPVGRHVVVLALLLLVVAVVPQARGTQAAFTDRSLVSTGALSSGVVAPVTGLTCSTGLLGLVGARLDWTAQPNREYVLYFHRSSDGTQVTTATTSTNSFVVSLANVPLLALGSYRVTVVSRLPGTSWVAPSGPSTGVRATTSLIYSCF